MQKRKKGEPMKINGKNFKRLTKKQHEKFKKTAENTLKKLGRPALEENKKYIPTYIRFHPKVVAWAKKESKKRGIGYQTVINDELLKKVSGW